MSTQLEEFVRQSIDELLRELSPEELRKYLSPAERVAGLSLEQRLEGLSAEDVEAALEAIRRRREKN